MWKKTFYQASIHANQKRYSADDTYKSVTRVLDSVTIPYSNRLNWERDTLVVICEKDQDEMLHSSAFSAMWARSNVTVLPVRVSTVHAGGKPVSYHIKICEDASEQIVTWVTERRLAALPAAIVPSQK
jgi:hypothetical protein